MDKQRESSRARRIRRTKVDWFGIIMMFVLLVCSLAIFARLMATKMLTTTNMVLIMVALLVVNGLHIFVQLPLRRNKLGKLICGVLAVVLSVVMIYGTVAAGAVQSALNKISGIMVDQWGFKSLKEIAFVSGPEITEAEPNSVVSDTVELPQLQQLLADDIAAGTGLVGTGAKELMDLLEQLAAGQAVLVHDQDLGTSGGGLVSGAQASRAGANDCNINFFDFHFASSFCSKEPRPS